MESITTSNYIIFFNENCYIELNNFLRKTDFSKIFILVDTNTHEHCLPYFLSQLETEIVIEIIEIKAGEIHKNIETCAGVWNALSELDADRKSLIINVGGGVVTDLGGFVASTFKRGIKYINVPTSLLSMVDASVGGKTGVDLGTLKNQIGVINFSEMVLIDTQFLNTLPTKEINSGMAEMLKHGLIQDEAYWKKMANVKAEDYKNFDTLIYESVVIKNNIVLQDPNENGLRKTLNYGHTLGHAIESYFLLDRDKPTLLHGEAIAIGMILATYLSKKLFNFPEEKLDFIKKILIHNYGKITFKKHDYKNIIELLKFDKKNSHGNINFVLLEDIAKTKIDCIVTNELILESFEYYST
ncbi:MAG: 3-dehydroquinate synthase [Bacteroidia bacterium]|nr:3-dehydroquinate synthase [Bacteroidia bacterium]